MTEKEMRHAKFVELIKVWATTFAASPNKRRSAYRRAAEAMAIVDRAMNLPAERVPTNQTCLTSAGQFIAGHEGTNILPEWAEGIFLEHFDS